jgi:hypothetical protein
LGSKKPIAVKEGKKKIEEVKSESEGQSTKGDLI